ncbi:MAG: GDP-L-fucose synthase [Alphaproteobacteria bacterium]|nr:GDP-L-fucose synthase [Alphaproteobacteria bacterium]
MSELAGRRVVVTGGAGFLGSHVVDRLRAGGAEAVVPRSASFDLRDAAACARLMAEARPSWVIHCAVDGGGIGYMRAHPAEVIRNNALMNTNVLHAAWAAGVDCFVGVSSVCAYPRTAPIPMREADLFSGYPEPSNAAYGLTKRMLMEQGRAYHDQHGFNAVFPMPTNLYGPRDDFEPARSHVVPALMRKCLEAADRGDDHIVAWGTGRATRELLYVEDCADAILAMARRWSSPEPVNIGNGREVPVRELVETVAAVCGFRGEIRWDTSKPDGQPRKCLDVSRAREGFGWTAQVGLAEGLRRTLDWYRAHRDGAHGCAG